MRKLFILMTALLLSAIEAAAGIPNVKGRVVSADDGEPVIGATVAIKGTKIATVTDLDGNFSLTGLPESAKELTVTFVGMAPVEAKLQPEMDITMHVSAQMMDEVVVVAFGKQKREAFTGSAGVLKSDDIERQLVNDPVTALDGKVAGVQITGDNDPSGSPTITIRGIGTINASSDPLIVVDGMPYTGQFSDINPADVDNISVLKDAASNALYGARGANGVILITTKSATRGNTRITFDARWGANTDAKVDYNVIDNPGEYYEAHYLALRNYYMRYGGMTFGEAHLKANAVLGQSSDAGGLAYVVYSVPRGETLIGTNGRLNPSATLGNRMAYNGDFYTLTPDNWRDYGLRNGLRQEYNVNLSGGNERSTFYASIGYLNNEGLSYGSKLERVSAKLKADYQAFSWLRVGGNASYTHAVADAQNESFNVCHNIAPIYPLFIRDGYGRIIEDRHGPRYDYGDGSNAGLIRQVEKSANSIQSDRLDTNRSNSNNFNLQGFVQADFLRDFRLTVNGSVYIQEYRQSQAMNPYYGYSADTGGFLWTQHYRNTDINFQQLLNWNHQFGQHNVEALIGHEYNRNTTGVISASKFNAALFEDNTELDGAIINSSIAGNTTMYNVEGFFVRGQYDFESRYYASASFRRDGSSRFHPDHRWGNFWSLGGAWIMSKEEWFPKTWTVNMLKLKLSYGEQGNDNITDFLYTDYYTIENSDDQVAILFKRKGNPNITWETAGNLNAGVEFELFNSRLNGSVEYYHRKTTDMLTTSQLPTSIGYSYYWDNIGDMVNQGVEINLQATPIRTRDLNWSINGNISINHNKITRLPDDRRQIDLGGHLGYSNGNFFYGEGLPLYTWYTHRYTGVTAEGLPTWQTSEAKADIGADGLPVTTADGRFITSTFSKAEYYDCGTALPTAYGGFGTTLQYRGFDLALQFNYSIGGKKLDYGYQTLMASPYSQYTGYNIHRDALLGWSEENPTSDMPRWQYADTNTSSTSDLFLTDASYLTFKSINFGYTLPKSITDKFRAKSLRIYFTVDNVAYWTARKGFDPRTVLHTGDDTAYSPMRTFMGGLNLQF